MTGKFKSMKVVHGTSSMAEMWTCETNEFYTEEVMDGESGERM